MALQYLDYRRLLALDALLSERSVTVAAERIGIGQSAVSNSLAFFRDYFDDEILVRGEHGFVLTRFAVHLQNPVRAALAQLRVVASAKQRFDPVTSNRKFNIRASEYVEAVFLPDVYRRVAKAAPGVTIGLAKANLPLGEDLFSDWDVAITINQGDAGNLLSELLFTDDYVCISCAANQSICQAPAIETYLAAGHVVPDLFPDRIEAILARQGRSRKVAVVASFPMMPQIVVGTPYIATLPRRLVHALNPGLAVNIWPCPLVTEKIEEFVYWPAYAETDPGLIWLRSLLRDIAG